MKTKSLPVSTITIGFAGIPFKIIKEMEEKLYELFTEAASDAVGLIEEELGHQIEEPYIVVFQPEIGKYFARKKGKLEFEPSDILEA